MKKGIIVLGLCLIGGLNVSSVEINKIVNINDLNNIEEKLRKNNVVFYNFDDDQTLGDTYLFSTYYYKENGNVKKGYLYGNKGISSNSIIKKKLSVYDEIQENTTSTKMTKMAYNNNDWTVDVDYKWSMVVEYKNKNICDYTEYVTSGYYNSVNYAYRYFEFRGFIAPTKDDKKVRTESLEFKIEPGDDANNWELYDYSPKKRDVSREITYGFSGQIGVDTNDAVSANLGFSKSWNALEESPTIHDYGNMSKNIADIQFEYKNCNENSGEFFEYSREQTNQNFVFVFRNDISNSKNISILDTRNLIMFYDHTWPKGNAHHPKSYTVNRIIEYR